VGTRLAATVRNNDVEKVGGTNEDSSLGTEQQVSEPAPLSEAALRRLREAAMAPDADAELAELVRALAAFEAKRAVDAAVAAKALPAQPLPAEQPPSRARVVGRRVGMALVIGALASTSAIALARSGGPRPGAGTGTPTRKVVLTDSPPGHDATASRSGSSTSPRPTSVRTGPTSPTPGTTPSSGPAASGTSTSAGVPVVTATGSPGPAGSPSASDSSSASGKPALVALCKRYARGGLPLKSAGYAKLVAAAGGADQIPAYCAALTSSTSTSTGASTLSQQQKP
jgi:hypothetical protein